MRFALALGLLISWCTSANAATLHHGKPPGRHFGAYPRVVVQPGERPAAPMRFAVPGWSDEQTRSWLGNASAASGLY
jgi:hypothetical protein